MKTPGRSWAQYSFYKYIACTLQTTSKQVEIHNRLLRPGVSFLYAKRHSEMNATSAIIAARDLVRPPLEASYGDNMTHTRKLHSLLRESYVINAEHLRLLQDCADN